MKRSERSESGGNTQNSACYTCGSRRWWISIYGVRICSRCHPPASPDLVREWEDYGDGAEDVQERKKKDVLRVQNDANTFAVKKIADIVRRALWLGWTWDSLREFAELLHDDMTVGKVTRDYIEIQIPEGSGRVTVQHFYNPDIEHPWVRRRGGFDELQKRG